ncbi:hypothetical protein BMA721280_A0992 [Burkholderia mallei 2002721280]|nr:hypothetical protein BMA721280_A0992 [Burkholderia mallei 2002721280]
MAARAWKSRAIGHSARPSRPAAFVAARRPAGTARGPAQPARRRYGTRRATGAPAAAIAPRGAAHVAKRIVRRTMTTETKRPAFEPPRAAVRMMRRGNASASRCPRTFGQGRAAAKPARPAAPTD